jgi:hypothetical protein
MRRRRTRLVLVGLAVLAVVGAVAFAVLREEGPGVLEGPEFRFSYPAEWERIEGIDFPQAQRLGIDDMAEQTVGLDLENYFTVYMRELPFAVDGSTVADYVPATREVLEEIVR